MTKPNLEPIAARIYAAVFEAMQPAEELGGPDYPDYIALMDAIQREATERAANCIAAMIEDAEQTRHRTAINAQCLRDARRMVAQWSAAQTREQFDALYLDWIGYSAITDAPDATTDELRDNLRDYIKEYCYATGIPSGLAAIE